MQLEDLASIEEWESLENEIRHRSGLNASVFNPEGYRITTNETWPNRLCPEIKATSKGQSFICATAHMNIANMAREERAAVIEECDAGLVKIVVPVFVDELFLGAVGACGLILGEGEVDTFLVNKITELEESRVEELAQGIDAIPLEQAQSLADFIQQQLDAMIARDRERRGADR